MKFLVKKTIRGEDMAALEHAMIMVDQEAKVQIDAAANTVSVDSWLMPEEFFVAFDDENYGDVRILED